jgi:hypothetical protein
VEFLIDQWHQFVERGLITAAPILQKFSYFVWRRSH